MSNNIESDKKENYEKVAGWALVFSLVLVLSIGNHVQSIIKSFNDVSEAAKLINPLISYAMPGLLAIWGTWLLVIYNYQRKANAPKNAIYYLWTSLLLTLALSCYFLIGKVSIGTGAVILLKNSGYQLFVCVLWTAYFLKSKRVKGTFVN